MSQDFNTNHENKQLARLAIFQRVYDVVLLLLFSTLRLTDILFTGLLALSILAWRPCGRERQIPKQAY